MKISFLKLVMLSSFLIVGSALQASDAAVTTASTVVTTAASSDVWNVIGQNAKAVFTNIGAAIGNLMSYAPGAINQATYEAKIMTRAMPKCPVTTLVALGMTSYCAYKAYMYLRTCNNVNGLGARLTDATGRVVGYLRQA